MRIIDNDDDFPSHHADIFSTDEYHHLGWSACKIEVLRILNSNKYDIFVPGCGEKAYLNKEEIIKEIEKL